MLEEVVAGLTAPVFLTHIPGDDRLFVVEQSGRVRIVDNGQLLDTPFLDIENLVRFQGEQGLLSMAFHPNYAANGFIYVYYTDLGGSSQVVRYTAAGNAVDVNSALTIMTIAQPF
jgi:glucose/arabinose dehydrogenase